MTTLNSVHQNLMPTDFKSTKYLPLSERKGKLPYTLQYDYFFKAALQLDESFLRSFLCSLLHLRPEDIASVSIENPIIIGSFSGDKEIVLDAKILLNTNRLINLEMQRLNRGDWLERSLVYLCRTFNYIKQGESYRDVLPAQHIGILNFPLKQLPAEFYTQYCLMNRKTYEIYSDKLSISVLNLSHTDLATEEDKYYRLDQWAALFKADTWEEIQMLVSKNPDFESIADALYFLTENRNLLDAYQRHEAEEAYKKYLERQVEEQAHALSEKDVALSEKAARIAELERLVAEKQRQSKPHLFSKLKFLLRKH